MPSIQSYLIVTGYLGFPRVLTSCMSRTSTSLLHRNHNLTTAQPPPFHTQHTLSAIHIHRDTSTKNKNNRTTTRRGRLGDDASMTGQVCLGFLMYFYSLTDICIHRLIHDTTKHKCARYVSNYLFIY